MKAPSAIVALFLSASCSFAAAQVYEIGPELWDRPRTGSAVIGHESVKRAVVAALAQPEARIIVHHGAGHEQQLQAEELRSWLVALAVDPRRVLLRADAVSGAQLRLEVAP